MSTDVIDRSEHDAAVTVRTALTLEPVRRGVPEILAGADRLDTSLRWVHAGEVPNIASLLKGGELLLTTGMGIAPDAAGQRRFISELVEGGLAAIAVELGTTFSTLPDPVIDEARKRRLPLIALHRVVPFVEITEALLHEIVNRRYSVLRRGDELQRSFTDLVLAGAGIPEVLQALSTAIANPVVLDKEGDGVLYHATHRTDSTSVLASWDAVRNRLTGSPEAFTATVPSPHDAAWGRLGAIALDSPLTDVDRIAVERAVELIGLELLRNRREEALAGRERGNFLSRLAAGKVDEREAARRARELRFDPTAPALLPIAVKGADRAVGSSGDPDGMWALLWRDARRALAAEGVAAVIGTRAMREDMLLVVGLDDPDRRRQLADRVAQILTACATRAFDAERPLVICAGGAARSWAQVASELRDAIDALSAAASAPERLWHDASHADLHRVLWSIRGSDALATFVRRRLAPLIEHDATSRSKLLPTLEVYCRLLGRKAEAARALHLERQSLYHRLERIEALIGEDLSDPETLLDLHLALRAHPYVARPAT